MAIVVESTATNFASNASGLTITKPTGLTDGDLMVAVLSLYGGGSSNATETDTWSTLSGWTSAIGANYNSHVSHSIQYKIATAGDVAASNFTFSATGSARGLTGGIIRCSGHAPVIPQVVGVTDSDTNGSGSTFTGTLSPYTPLGNGALVIIQVGGFHNSDSFSASLGGWTTDDDITFTELYDNAFGGDTPTMGAGGSYGIQTTADEISSYSASFSRSRQSSYGQFAVFLPPVSATVTNALLQTSPVTFATLTGSTQEPTNDYMEISPDFPTQSGRGTTPTQWSNESKPLTTWTNET
jgi:hypothetical protein